LGAIYVVVFLTSTCAQFFNPARLALTGDIVPEVVQGRAFGLDYTTESLAIVVGPPISAALFLAGIHWALLVNAISFAVSFVAIRRIRPPEAAHSVAPGECGNALHELRAGIRFIARSRELIALAGVLCLIILGVGCLNSLMPLYVQLTLRGTPQNYALLVATIGVGAICGALVASAVVPRLGSARSFWIGTLLLGIDILAFSQMRSFAPALITAFLAGPPQAFVNVATGPLILKLAPRALVGRVSSLLTPLVTASSLISTALAGYLASTLLVGFQVSVHAAPFRLPLALGLGTITAIFAGAGVLAICGALVAIFALRGLDVRNGQTPDDTPAAAREDTV
jgi:Na+/melibiose symporter-like transporter